MILPAVALCTLVLTHQLPAAPAQALSVDEEAVRAAVQQYYDAQAARDPDKAASFWSASANPRMTRDTFLALFGAPADEKYTLDIRSVAIAGAEARVRVMWLRTRVEMRGGQAFTSRQSALNSQTWRKEGESWKLLRDTPFADELADRYLELPEADRAKFLGDQTPQDRAMLRFAVSTRATMAVTVAKDFARGRALFERALEISRATNDRVGEANSLHNIAQADYNLRDYPAATAAFSKELEVGRQAADDAIASSALYGLGMVAYASGEYSSALGSYRDALALYEKRDDGSSANRALISIGNIQYLQADYDAASTSYRRAESLATAGQDPQGATLARGGLARVLAAQGDFAAALDTYAQLLTDARAAAAADPRMTNGVAVTLDAIGEVHFRIGNMDQARANFDEARKLLDGDPSESARLLMSLGLTDLLAGKYEAALADYTEGRARYEKAKEASGVARAWIGTGFSQAARQKWDEAIAAYKTAIRMFETSRNDGESARGWLGLSLAQSGAGDNTAALESARKVTAIGGMLKSDDLTWRGDIRVGEALEKLARLDEARTSFESAIEIIDRLAAEAPVNPDVRRQLDDSATAWAGLALTLAKAGNPRGALNAMEARRAHIRRMHLAGFQRDIAIGESEDERGEEQALARDLASAYALVKAEQSAPHPDQARLERLGQQLNALIVRRAEQQNRLYAKLPDLQRWRGLTKPADVDLAALVPADNVVVLEYLVTDEDVLVLAIDRHEDSPEVTSATIALTRHDLADRVAAAIKPAVLQDAAAWKTAAEPLRGLLLAPVSDKLRDRTRCLIVPDDVLWKVPFEALPDGEGTLTGRMTVTYATSLTTLALERQIPATPLAEPARVNAAFVAAPAIPPAIRAQLALTQPGWKEPDAAAALARVQESGKPYGDTVTVKTAADATEPAVRTLFASAEVLQLSGPFHVSGPSPLFSSMLLAGGAEAGPDELRWEAREWFAAKASVRLLVIDDASMLGAAGAGGALDTLAWAAAAAGVPAIVVARWPSEAFALDVLEPALHAEISQGHPAADALHSAAATVRTKSPAPAGWAGLRLIGAS